MPTRHGKGKHRDLSVFLLVRLDWRVWLLKSSNFCSMIPRPRECGGLWWSNSDHWLMCRLLAMQPGRYVLSNLHLHDKLMQICFLSHEANREKSKLGRDPEHVGEVELITFRFCSQSYLAYITIALSDEYIVSGFVYVISVTFTLGRKLLTIMWTMEVSASYEALSLFGCSWFLLSSHHKIWNM